MAFLLPVATAAVGAVLGNLMNKVINKIVGDAEVPEQALALIDGMAANVPEIKSWLMTNPVGLTQSELETVQNSPEFLFRNALSQSRGQLNQLMTMPQSSVALNQATNAVRNHLGQTVSDAAAVKQITQQVPAVLNSANNNMMMNSPQIDLANAQLQSIPQRTPYSSSSSSNAMQPRFLAQAFQQQQSNLPQSPQLAQLQQFQTSIPQLMHTPVSSSIIQAQQPLFKTMTNQSVLTPNIQNNNMETNETGVVDTAKAVGNAMGQTFMGTAAQAAKAGLVAGGEQLAVAGSNALSKLISKTATGFGSFIAKGLGTLVNKIIGDAPVPIFDINNSRIPFDDVPTSISNESIRDGMSQALIKARGPVLLGGPDSVPDFKKQGFGNYAEMVAAQTGSKIIGDAPVPTFSAGNNRKVVGDAPPSSEPMDEQPGMMTNDQYNAAMANLSTSGSFNLLSQLLLEEQVQQLAMGLPNGLNVIELNRNLGAKIETKSATFQQDQVTTVIGFQGSPQHKLYADLIVNLTNADSQDVNLVTTGTAQLVINVTGEGYLGVHHHRVRPPKIAPPMGGNITLDTLKPLLLGAATTEYSSQLRIRTSIINVDRMLKAVAVTSHNLEASTGYSFSLPLIKIMGLLLEHFVIWGENQTAYGTGMNATYAQDGDGTSTYRRMFPFNLETQLNQTMAIAVITEQNFIATMAGEINTTGWDARFLPQTWGQSTAVVFIRAQDISLSELNLVRIISKMAYPFCLLQPLNTAIYTFVRATQGNVITRNTPASLFTRTSNDIDNYLTTSLNRIEGPTNSVLIVVTGTVSDNQDITVNIGPPGAGGNLVDVNTVNNGPANPEVLVMGGGEMVVWGDWLGSNRCIPTLMAFIRSWEQNYGNNSDRSTALRFWADFSRRWGPTSVGANNIHQGSPQSGGNFLTTSPTPYLNNVAVPTWNITDLPVWLITSSTLITQDNNISVGYNYLIKSATGLTPEEYLLDPNNNYKTTMQSRDNIVTMLGSEDFMVDYLVVKRWIYCNEEYPVSRLDDPSRMAVTVATMSNIMASLTDLLCQSLDILHAEFWVPGLRDTNLTARMRYERVQAPALNELFLTGIQFPTMEYQRWTDVEATYIPTLRNANNTSPAFLYALVFGNAMLTGAVFSSVARIPRQLMADWCPVFLPMQNKLRLNFPPANPSRRFLTIANERLVFFQFFVGQDLTSLNNPEQMIYARYLSRLTQGVVMQGDSPNPGWLVFDDVTKLVAAYYVNIRSPSEARDTLINYSCGRGNLALPALTNLGLPKVENLITRDPGQGYSPLTGVIIGPLDAFGPGDGTYDYDMYYTMSGGYAAITTNVFTLVPEDVFSGSGIQHLFSNF